MGDEMQIGGQLRAARKGAGLSLSTMALRTNFSVSHLSNVEREARAVTPDILLAYERVLGDMQRRTLLTGIAANVFAPAIMAEALHGAFTAALGEPVSVEEWRSRAEDYGRDYMTMGASALSSRLVGDMVHLQQSVSDPGIWAPAARLMTVYGKTLPANEGSKGAVKWYWLASQLADRSGDRPIRIWVRGRAALALAYEAAELPTARLLADQAIALADGKPSLGLLNALSARAHVAGAIGDKATAVTTMEDAARVFDASGSPDDISDFAVPEWRFHTFASMLWSRLGDEPRAVQSQDAADRTRPATLPRFATHIELHRGLMLARSGDKGGGLAHAQAALDRLPPERRSLSLRLMMDEVRSA